MSLAENLKQVHNLKVNTDYLIAIALLHDVSKLLEHEEKDGKCTKSRNGALFPHGYLGGFASLEAGLPIEVVHAIVNHTVSLPMVPKTVEASIVGFADLADNDALRMASGLKSLREIYHF